MKKFINVLLYKLFLHQTATKTGYQKAGRSLLYKLFLHQTATSAPTSINC